MDIKIQISLLLRIGKKDRMISQSAEYSLRAVVCLAMAAGKPLTTRRMAGLSHVPAGYLAKVLNALRRAGIVVSQRGAGGGHHLGRLPAGLTLLEVIRVADLSHRIPVCPLGIGSHGTTLCGLHRSLDQAIEIAEQALGKTTIADVLEDQTHRPLCEDKLTQLEVVHARHD